MTISGAVGIWFLGELGDLAVESGAKGLWSRISERAARQTLADACAKAVEAAVGAVPSLAEDLRSSSFCDGVALPLVRSLLEDPSQLITAETFAGRYVDMFVSRFSRADGIDATLRRIFQVDRAGLLHAFEAFLAALKAALYASEHWREEQHYQTTEVILAQVTRISTLLDQRDAGQRAATVDIDRATRDAELASAELRAWPSEIHGVRLETPVLDRLVQRVLDQPAESTLLVGEAGTGKSALFARLAAELEARDITVFAIKADLLPASIASLSDLARALGVDDGLDDRIAALAAERPVVVLLDQLDAVSDVMDRQSYRMRVLLQLVHRLGPQSRRGLGPLNVHVIVSSRPFEAAHDARFHQLEAETITLGQLRDEQVDELLVHLGVDPQSIDARLRPSLRRPFALKLFADIVSRGRAAASLSPASLLDAWLASADLGGADERAATLRFLSELAEEMIATETLWRPADAFETAHSDALARAEATGLVVRSHDLVGFSHQSWLDDFQAKAFRNAGQLAPYTWERQDSLFVRASLLRGLERLRTRDATAYDAALASLLSDARTRRHIRHLIADFIAARADPRPAEIGWIVHWLHHDVPLAGRTLRHIHSRWEFWRDSLKSELPTVMVSPPLHWQAAQILAAEVRHDAASVTGLLDRFWRDPDKDKLIFQLLELANFIGLEVQSRLRTIFGRSDIDDYMVAHMLSTLRADQRFEEAAEILGIWLEFQETDQRSHPKLYELEKLAEEGPEAVVRILLPWFVQLASRNVEPDHDIMARFPRSHSLPYDFETDPSEGHVIEALRHAVEKLGQADPTRLWALLQPLAPINIDQVQEMIALGLVAAGGSLAEESLRYLLADTRRFQISSIITTVEPGVIGSVEGWHSHQLVSAIAGGLDDDQLAVLRDAIENWSCYTAAALDDAEDDLRARRARDADEERLPLLEAIPALLLDPARRAQIEQRRIGRPRVDRRSRDDAMSWVGPPMTNEEMGEADDDAVFALLDKFHDGSGEQNWSRPISRSGGVRELSRAFGAFGKKHAERASRLAARLLPGRHERAAGELVKALAQGAGEGAVSPAASATALALIKDFDGRGFASSEWRLDAAHALRDIAQHQHGLDDHLIHRLEAWIETDPAVIARQVAERKDFETRYPRQRRERDKPWPILFGPGGGMEVLPSANFTILDAIAVGLLCRQPADFDGWADSLARHVDQPEDEAIWTALLAWPGRYLLWADPDRVTTLLRRLWERFPQAFADVRMASFFWQMRARVPDEAVIGTMVSWMIACDTVLRQAAGEFLTAAHLVQPDTPLYRLLFDQLDRGNEEVETGVLFAASAAWRERDPTLRPPAHAILLGSLPTAQGATVHALSRAVDSGRSLIPDKLTSELLMQLTHHPEVLRATLNHHFMASLQGLLLVPGFDALIMELVSRITDLILADGRVHGPFAEELVRVTIALQRSDGPLRSKAMDVYERLLDAAVYGAETAAQAALERTC